MGHRKKHAPRRGSLAFRPRGRAASLVVQPHYWPVSSEAKILGFAGYKVGMSHAYLLEDDQTSPNYGREIFTPVTIIETPPITVCALRAYESTVNGLKTAGEAWAQTLPKDLNRAIKTPPQPKTEEALKKLEERLDHIAEFRAVICTHPSKAGVHKKKPEVFETALGGKTPKEQLEFGKNILGRDVDVASFVKAGQYVDVAAVTKGKGFAGPVKRFGVRILQNKSRKTVRGIACLGPWHPALVTSTVARAGQMGFARRVEFNKRVLKVGANGAEVTPKGGFLRYGTVRCPFIVLKGSVPGPAKRPVILRQPVRGAAKITPPNITLFPPHLFPPHVALAS